MTNGEDGPLFHAADPDHGNGESTGEPAGFPASPALSGDLGAFRVHDLCQLLGLAQATGRLYLRAPGVHGVIEVEAGAVVGAAIRPNPERLGQILLQMGVPPGDLERALGRQMAGDRRPLGTLLTADLGLASATLRRALMAQHRAALAALLILPAGRFVFQAGPVAAAAGQRFDFESLLLQALTRLDELDPGRIPPE
jgi:hypothetical protein